MRWRMIILSSRQIVLITPLDMILKGLLIVHYELQCCETSRIYSKWSICHKYYIRTVSFVCFEGIVYSCNLCDHNETWQDHLKKHQQSKHEGLRYSSNQCEYRATLQGNLKTHEQNKYSCKQCEFQATGQDQLKTHQQYQHTGVKCSCIQCEYEATTQRFLKTHQQSKHEGVKYSCTQCEYQSVCSCNCSWYKVFIMS